MRLNISNAQRLEVLREVTTEVEVQIYRTALRCGISPDSLTTSWQPADDSEYPETAVKELLAQLAKLKNLQDEQESLG